MNSLKFIRVCGLTLIALTFSFTIQAHSQELEVVEVFWTELNSANGPIQHFPRVEVAKNDSKAVFAIKLANQRKKPIAAINARLDLPAGIRAATGKEGSIKFTHDGIVPSGNSLTLTFPVVFLPEFQGETVSCNLGIDYREVNINFDSGDSPNTFNRSLPVEMRMTGKSKLALKFEPPLFPGSASDVEIVLANQGTAVMSNIQVGLPGSLAMPGQHSTNNLLVAGQKDFEFNSLSPGSEIKFNTVLYASQAAADSVQSLPISLQYINGCHETVRTQSFLSVSVSSKRTSPILSLVTDAPAFRISAGKIIESSHTLKNVSGEELATGTIALKSLDPRLKIMSTTDWSFDRLEPGEEFIIEPSFLATKELLSRTAEFQITIEAQRNGKLVREQYPVPVYIAEDVQVVLQETKIVNIAGVPHLTGRLLNQGIGSALFCEIRLIEDKTWSPVGQGKQYLGDLAENSPLPFSLPLQSRAEGEASLKLRFLNGMREPNEMTLIANVSVSQQLPVQETSANPQKQNYLQYFWLGGGILAGILLCSLFRPGRKSKVAELIEKQRLALDEDFDQAIESTEPSGETS